jgi:hypothetical protein
MKAFLMDLAQSGAAASALSGSGSHTFSDAEQQQFKAEWRASKGDERRECSSTADANRPLGAGAGVFTCAGDALFGEPPLGRKLFVRSVYTELATRIVANASSRLSYQLMLGNPDIGNEHRSDQISHQIR